MKCCIEKLVKIVPYKIKQYSVSQSCYACKTICYSIKTESGRMWGPPKWKEEAIWA